MVAERHGVPTSDEIQGIVTTEMVGRNREAFYKQPNLVLGNRSGFIDPSGRGRAENIFNLGICTSAAESC